MKRILLLFFFIVIYQSLSSQNLFHSSNFYGGVTCAGFSTGQGAGTGTKDVYIEPNSTIRKAYLFSYTMGNLLPDTITINNNNFQFDTVNLIMNVTHANAFVSPIKLYYTDITSYLQNNLTTQYNISIFNTIGTPIGWGTWTATIYIEYENPNLPKVNTAIWVNDKKYIGDESYVMKNVSPFDTNYPVGFSIFSDRSCSVITDGTIVNVNNSTNDTIWGEDQSSINGCNGVKGHFYYQNNTLYGLDDDTPDNIMYHSDALADISTYLTNPNSFFTLNLKHTNPNGSIANRNLNLLFITAYTSPCDTFSVSTTFTDTTICKGDTLNMQVTGGDTYNWQPSYGLSCNNCPNPIISPDNSTYYSLTVSTINNCRQTIPILVKVNDSPTLNTPTITPDTCSFNTGTINLTANGGTPPYTYSLNNGMPQNNATFNQLPFGNYQTTVTDANGFKATQNTYVPTTIITQANYTATPSIANPPAEVELNNQSEFYTNSIWYISDANTYITLDSFFTKNANYTFQDTDVYSVMLISYNQTPSCADTTYGVIQIVPPFSINIPNVITPNQDLVNDAFTIDIEGAKKH